MSRDAVSRRAGSRPNRHDPLDAAPLYLGRKGWLVAALFALIRNSLPQEQWPASSFVDAFTGSATVAISAKRLGFGAVTAIDCAERGVIAARALVENSTVRLRDADVVLALAAEPATKQPTLLEHLTPPLGSTVASLHGQMTSTGPGPTRDLLGVMLMHLVLRAFPMSVPDTSDAPRAAAGDFDSVSPSRLRHYVQRQARLAQLSSVLEVAARINAGVIPGLGHALRGDALELLPSLEADVVYLDPPYGGTRHYERTLVLLDELFGDDELAQSAFSTSEPPLDELLDACRHIELVALSLGNARLERDQLEALVQRHRQRIRIIEIPRRHLASIASASKNARSAEYLVIAQ